MKRVVVLAGGLSSERSVSLDSGKNVLKALLSKGYEAMMIDVQQPVSALAIALERLKPDVVFNALHGKYGEDGCIQGLLNLMHVPYTHSGVLASALSMNKQRTKEALKVYGIDVPAGRLVSDEQLRHGDTLPKPYVIKPNDEGSSVGVYIIQTDEDEAKMLAENIFDKPVLMEEYIAGRELSVVVTDKGAIGVVEIVPTDGFYDYEHKYTTGAAGHIIPACLSTEWTNKLMHAAAQAHRVLGCRGVSRSDFRLDEKVGRGVFLELNANPGMTSLSLVPDVMHKIAGVSYADFVADLVDQAAYED